GEDVVAGELILPTRHRLRAVDLGVLRAAGVDAVRVLAKPRVAVIPTGTELISAGSAPETGEIIDSNSLMFSAMAEDAGAEAVRCAPVKDDYAAIRSAVSRAVDESDMVLVNAGSSAGTEDYTVHVLRELGEVVVHGVAVKPGKPVILAVVRGKPVVGLPGYPVAAYLSFLNFAQPVLTLLGGHERAAMGEVRAVLSRRLLSSVKYTEYVRVKLGCVADKWVASPLDRGSGAAMSLVRADGFCRIPQNCEGLESGEEISVQLCRPLSELENTLVLIGSHDVLLDVMEDMMSARGAGLRLSSTHVGSLGGLMALRRGECHMAPTHLLDEDGTYNVHTIRDLFPDEPMLLVKGVGRLQGLMVKKGNPLNIRGVEDLPRCRYVNRQRGAGTRILLDSLLASAGVAPETINGYDREAATHMAVAALVASDSADVGMGAWSAANAMGLDFVPVGWEEYDFALPAAYRDLPQVRQFLDLLRSDAFHARLAALGGYQCPRSGEIVEI
ncbi:MAG: molybdopterin biosynthesis protein, partial [Oscillibacter sp.]|nr:molybdopterin biosynthesis protein [Oscillibacter sp.]